MADRISPDKEKSILLLLEKGYTHVQIADIVGVHKYTVANVAIRNKVPQKLRTTKIGDDVRLWLLENWHFTMPVKIIKKKKHTQFRTPYNYPKMWRD